MLANGATLGYRKHTDGENSAAYTDLPGLKEIPEVGVELDKEENTCLTDPHKMYEEGIGDLPDMKYKWKYDNSKAGSPYRLMRDAADKKEIWDFQEKTKDGTVTEFTAQFSVKRTGGGVNGVIEFEATMAVQSEIKQTVDSYYVFLVPVLSVLFAFTGKPIFTMFLFRLWNRTNEHLVTYLNLCLQVVFLTCEIYIGLYNLCNFNVAISIILIVELMIDVVIGLKLFHNQSI